MALTDFFGAKPAELTKVAKAGRVPATLPKFETKDFHIVPLAKLAKLLGVGDDGVEDGDPPCHDDGYNWFVLEVQPELVKAVAALSDADVKKHGAAIAKIPELGWPAADGRSVVGRLRDLAKKAPKGARLYVWVCA